MVRTIRLTPRVKDLKIFFPAVRTIRLRLGLKIDERRTSVQSYFIGILKS
jgi:hypothetical protein